MCMFALLPFKKITRLSTPALLSIPHVCACSCTFLSRSYTCASSHSFLSIAHTCARSHIRVVWKGRSVSMHMRVVLKGRSVSMHMILKERSVGMHMWNWNGCECIGILIPFITTRMCVHVHTPYIHARTPFNRVCEHVNTCDLERCVSMCMHVPLKGLWTYVCTLLPFNTTHMYMLTHLRVDTHLGGCSSTIGILLGDEYPGKVFSAEKTLSDWSYGALLGDGSKVILSLLDTKEQHSAHFIF